MTSIFAARSTQAFLSRCTPTCRGLAASFRSFSTSPQTKEEASALSKLGKSESDKAQARKPSASTKTDFLDQLKGNSDQKESNAHHFHVYATKHNTHITLTKPDRASIISLSAGNIGFRKAARGSYDAAYQLAAYVLMRIYEGGLLDKITKLEVVLRGFGVGREAVTKALLGAEGRLLRGKIAQVSDATRLKFGGTRSKKPRRLG